MDFKVRWCRETGAQVASWSNPEDEATLAELALYLAGEALTRAEGTLSGEVREHAVLPAGRLAEWFVWNWWRLRWEPRRVEKAMPLDWLVAHQLGAVGSGWLWPNVEFRSDGVRMVVQARPSAQVPASRCVISHRRVPCYPWAFMSLPSMRLSSVSASVYVLAR